MSRNGTKRYKKGPFTEKYPQDDRGLDDDDYPAIARRLPWETSEEYRRFCAYLFATPRTVREAYRRYCEAGGKTPRKDPPSSWFQLAKGGYQAFRKTDQRVKAIEIAEEKYGRVVDWEAITYIVKQASEEGELDPDVYQGEFGETMTSMKVIEVGFMSLAININGDPIPGALPWVERLLQSLDDTQ